MPLVTVNYWPKNDVDSPFGHVSLTLPADRIYISWCPSAEDTLGKLYCPAVVAQTRQMDNEHHKNPTEIEIQLSEEKVKVIKEWWKGFTATHKTYKALYMNCSTVVFKALYAAFPKLEELEAINIWVPDYIKQLADELQKGEEQLTDKKLTKLKEDFSKLDELDRKTDEYAKKLVSWMFKKAKKTYDYVKRHIKHT